MYQTVKLDWRVYLLADTILGEHMKLIFANILFFLLKITHKMKTRVHLLDPFDRINEQVVVLSSSKDGVFRL